MALLTSIPVLRNLLLYPGEDGERHWIWYEDFIKFLRQHYCPTDQKQFRPDAVLREIKGYRNGMRFIEDKQKQISLQSLLRYTFHHAEDYNICQQIAFQIEASLLKGSHPPAASTIHEIYRAISKSSLKDPALETLLLSNIDLSEYNIPTLYTEYQEQFTGEEWKRISLFEWHFSREYNVSNCGYEEEVKLRWDFLHSIRYAGSLTFDVHKQIKKIISQRLKIKAVEDSQNGVLLHELKTHIPSLIDLDIQECISSHSGENITSVVSIDCSNLCHHKPGLHVFVEVEENKLSLVNEIASLIQSLLRTEHDASCEGVVFLSPGTCHQFRSASGLIQRFHLKDAFYQQQLKDFVMYNWTPSANNAEKSLTAVVSENERCQKCFSDSIPQPFSSGGTAMITEWNLDVPLSLQIIFESFISKVSLRRLKKDQQSFLQKKIARLHTAFESLLNVSNKCYIGKLQDMNTKQLVMSYHNVESVFSVTNTSGATTSLRSAERHLKEDADPDTCYYNTYIRRYPLEYDTLAGSKMAHVNLRECHLILFLDNLVRLTFHDDPVPGQSRSSQVCTLPITLKGVPKDAAELESWHDANTCDGSDKCSCKDQVQLGKDDMDGVLLELSSDEADAFKRFKKLCNWALCIHWKDFYSGDFKSLIDKAVEAISSDEVDSDVLNESMRSLNLEDGITATTEAFSDIKTTTDPFSDIKKQDQGQSVNQNSIDEEHSSDESEAFEELLNDSEDESDSQEGACCGQDEDNYLPSLCESLNISGISDVSLGEEDVVVPFTDNENKSSSDKKQTLMGFSQYKPPPTICRHPPPAIGRDDDRAKLREILDDVLIKSAHLHSDTKDRILFAPDHKIAKNLFHLMRDHNKYQAFLPEFPVLHLRKSKINNLGAAYKDAGIKQLLKYMKDDDQQNEWAKLVTADHIDAATKVIRRLGLSLHLAFLIKFLQHLPPLKAADLQQDILTMNTDDLAGKWDASFEIFLEKSANDNSTFCLHKEMMQHCDEVVAISFAERVGGKQGYNLLTAIAKSSLPFSFLNGASSYASYCTDLLYHHGQAGYFHKNMKESLFTTPHKGSSVNFGLDSQREMDHKDALKGFRPRATPAAVLPRLSLVDKLSTVNETRMEYIFGETKDIPHSAKGLSWTITSTDLKHILPTASLILRRGGLQVVLDHAIKNIYAKDPTLLPDTVLDMNSWDVGKFLLQKYCCQQQLFGLTADDIPDVLQVNGPKALINKVKRGKSVTVRRVTGKVSSLKPSEREVKEGKRQKKVARDKKEVDCLSSDMNTCQAVVKPDCSKPAIQKSKTIKTALMNLLTDAMKSEKVGAVTDLSFETLNSLPDNLKQTIKTITLEFAGVKFKTPAESGEEYLLYVENSILRHITSILPNTKCMIICEEKYSFTPDDFKAATRAKRQKTVEKSVGYLKTGKEMLSLQKFDKKALVTTKEGKTVISTFLAASASMLSVKKDLILDIDSEWHIKGCNCSQEDSCSCYLYTIPVRCLFSKHEGYIKQFQLKQIHQRKGEAEMSQVDWLMDCLPELGEGDAVLSWVTSGDIDAVLIHMFLLSHMWPRNDDGSFKHQVYVLLQRPGNVFNMTAIISVLEAYFSEREVGMKIALALCMGGNDFIPKYYNISHDKMLKAYVSNKEVMDKLFLLHKSQDGIYVAGKVDKEMYRNFIKLLYTPLNLQSDALSFEEVRQLSVKLPKDQKHRNPQCWMPPPTAIDKLAQLLECQIEYLLTAGFPSADKPLFLQKGCLKKAEGNIEYNLGPDTHVTNWQDLVSIPEDILASKMKEVRKKWAPEKRKQPETPQKGQRRKIRPITSTPKKARDPT